MCKAVVISISSILGLSRDPSPPLGSEVEVLVRSAAPDECWLRSPNVNVLVQNLGSSLRRRHSLSSGDLLVDMGASLLVDGLELLLGSHGPVQNVLLQAGDGVVGATHALNLLASSVSGTRVGHGVTSVSVGDVFKDHRSVVSIGPLLAILDSSLNSKAVHAVDLQTRDVLSTLVVVRESRGTGRCRTHTVLVVCGAFISNCSAKDETRRLTLASEKSRQLPQLRHVERLKDLALVAGTVTVQDDGGLLAARVLVRKSQTGTNRDLSADDTVAAVEVLDEHVHRSTLAVGDTLASTEQFANDGSDSASSHQRKTVASVRGDDIVIFGDSMLDTDCNGFLTGGKVAETSDLLLFVQPIGGHLHLSVLTSVNACYMKYEWCRYEAYRIVTISEYICFSSFFVTSMV